VKTVLEFGGLLGVVWKALGESDLNRVYFIIFKAKVWKIFDF
jgi:hypothetical protein